MKELAAASVAAQARAAERLAGAAGAAAQARAAGRLTGAAGAAAAAAAGAGAAARAAAGAIYKENARANSQWRLIAEKNLAVFLIFFLFVTNLLTFAAPTKELSALDANVYTQMEQNDAARAYNSRVQERFSEQIELAPSVTLAKDRYYEGELIVLDIAVKSSYARELDLSLELGYNADMQLLSLQPAAFSAAPNGGIYRARAYLRAKNPNAMLTSLDATLHRASEQVATAHLQLSSPQIAALPHDKDFSGIVAPNLSLKGFKCSPYDDEHIICAGALAADNAALSGIFLRGAASARLSANNRNYERNEAFASLILPAHFKRLGFSFFNPISSRFERIEREIVVQSEDLSTQSDLAPSSKELGFTLQLICLVLAIFCTAVVLYFRRFYGLLAAAIIFAALGLLNGTSLESAQLAPGAVVRILPTPGATVFERTSRSQSVKILGSYGKFSKIQLPDERIGWVESSALQ